MTDQQLYIDGILMDMSEDSAITLDIKSNLFRDITKMTANTTYTINLPKTAHNMAVLEFAGKPSTSSKYPYIFTQHVILETAWRLSTAEGQAF